MTGFQPKNKRSASAEGAQAPQLGFPSKGLKSAAQAQVQNQAPDSIPAMVAPGEFILPPDTVHAMGGKEALNQVVQATHTPAPVNADVPKGFHPQMFFANGGAPEDQPRSNSFGDAAAASLDSRVSQIPTGGLKAPVPDGSQNNPLNTDIGRNVNNTMMALPGIGGLPRVASTGGAISSSFNNAAAPGVNAASRMAAFGTGVAAAGPASAQAPAPTSTTAPGAQAGAGAGRGLVNPSMAEPSKPLQQPGPANAPSGTEVMPGVYRNGNSYGDSAGAALAGAQPGGMPSAQNMAAAENLALGLRPRSAGASAPEQPGLGFHPGMAAPQVAHSGNSWSAQNALRNAQVSASSIMNNGGSWDKHKGVSPERAYAAAMENADFAARGAQPGMNQAAMRENAAIQREGMQQAGSTARAQMQEVGQNNRFGQTQGLARDKFGLEQETQGIQNRDASLISAMRAQIAQEQDPAKRQAIVQRLREMQGQTQPSEWGVQVTPTTKNFDGSTSMGSVIRFNKATGAVEQVPMGGRR